MTYIVSKDELSFLGKNVKKDIESLVDRLRTVEAIHQYVMLTDYHDLGLGEFEFFTKVYFDELPTQNGTLSLLNVALSRRPSSHISSSTNMVVEISYTRSNLLYKCIYNPVKQMYTCLMDGYHLYTCIPRTDAYTKQSSLKTDLSRMYLITVILYLNNLRAKQ